MIADEYDIIIHANSNRRRHERLGNGKTIYSNQFVRCTPRAVEIKRAERLKRKAYRPS